MKQEKKKWTVCLIDKAGGFFIAKKGEPTEMPQERIQRAEEV